MIVSCDTNSGFGPVDRVFNNYDWEDIGNVILDSEFSVLGLGFDNTRYLAYRNGTNDKAAVSVFNGSSWVIYGSNGHNIGDDPTYLSLASDKNGNLFLAHDENKSQIRIKSNSGSSSAWSTIYTVLPAPDVTGLVIKTDSANNKYLFYLYGNGTKEGVVLKSLAGSTAFNNLGTTAFIDTYAGDFIIDSSNKPVVAYAKADGLYVAVWNGSDWNGSGSGVRIVELTSPQTVSEISLASGNGKIYVAYKDPESNDVVSVMVLNNGTWIELPFLLGADKPSLKINSKGIPVLAVRDLSQTGHNDIATVYFLEDNKWQVLGGIRNGGIEDSIDDSIDKPINMEIDTKDKAVVSFVKRGLLASRYTSVLNLIER